MKYDFMIKTYGTIYLNLVKDKIKDKKMMKDIKKEYRLIMERASDIGSKNMLLSSYCLAGVFIAMNRVDKLDAETNYSFLRDGFKGNKLIRMFLGDAKTYYSEKKMEARRKWSKDTYERKYKNDWLVDVVPGDDVHEFGFDYKECGVCKLCKDEGCFELAKYLCRLDFLIVEVIGIKLDRTKTLAEGGDLCDFRFRKKGN